MKKNLTLIKAKNDEDVCIGCVFCHIEDGCMEEENTELYNYPEEDNGCYNDNERQDYIYIVSLIKILKKL